MSDDFYSRFPRSGPPRAAKGGIKAHSRRGAFGATWWARRWIAVLERLELGGRLARGRSYARKGQVLSLSVAEGRVAARVQGSRPQPYDVTVEVATLGRKAWAAAGAALAREARFAARLLAGEMPQDVEEAFRAAGVALFPERRDDLRTACSCPDWSNPCKHVAAVYYLLGEEFDRDPFLVFRLRGLDREALVGLLGRGPAPALEAAPPALPPEPLPADSAAFWRGGDLPEEVAGDAQPAPVSAGMIQRLGRFPFWRGREPILESLLPAYERAAAGGLAVFLGERPEPRGGARDRQP